MSHATCKSRLKNTYECLTPRVIPCKFTHNPPGLPAVATPSTLPRLPAVATTNSYHQLHLYPPLTHAKLHTGYYQHFYLGSLRSPVQVLDGGPVRDCGTAGHIGHPHATPLSTSSAPQKHSQNITILYAFNPSTRQATGTTPSVPRQNFKMWRTPCCRRHFFSFWRNIRRREKIKYHRIPNFRKNLFTQRKQRTRFCQHVQLAPHHV